MIPPSRLTTQSDFPNLLVQIENDQKDEKHYCEKHRVSKNICHFTEDLMIPRDGRQIKMSKLVRTFIP